MGAQLDRRRQAGRTVSGQDSGILDVEDEEEDDEVRNLQSHIFTVPTLQFLFRFYLILLSVQFRYILTNRCRLTWLRPQPIY